MVGPSGVGKDSLIAALAAADPRLVSLRRAITRPADATEPFRPVTDAQFDAMAATGAFVLAWGAHGLRLRRAAGRDRRAARQLDRVGGRAAAGPGQEPTGRDPGPDEPFEQRHPLAQPSSSRAWQAPP